MKTIRLKTESYIFKNSNSEFRAIPFYELSIDEWIIFENGTPKYYLDFNNRTAPLISDINKKLDSGDKLDDIITNIGNFLGKNWTIKHNIIGEEILHSEKDEIIEVCVITDLSELFIDLYFVATEKIDVEELSDENRLFDKYLNKGNEIQSSFIDNYKNLNAIFSFIFKTKFDYNKLYEVQEKKIFDLTEYKNKTIELEDFNSNYKNLLQQIERENSMDEFANILGILNYIKKYCGKQHLILIAEKRKHYA